MWHMTPLQTSAQPKRFDRADCTHYKCVHWTRVRKVNWTPGLCSVIIKLSTFSSCSAEYNKEVLPLAVKRSPPCFLARTRGTCVRSMYCIEAYVCPDDFVQVLSCLCTQTWKPWSGLHHHHHSCKTRKCDFPPKEAEEIESMTQANVRLQPNRHWILTSMFKRFIGW